MILAGAIERVPRGRRTEGRLLVFRSVTKRRRSAGVRLPRRGGRRHCPRWPGRDVGLREINRRRGTFLCDLPLVEVAAEMPALASAQGGTGGCHVEGVYLDHYRDRGDCPDVRLGTAC